MLIKTLSKYALLVTSFTFLSACDFILPPEADDKDDPAPIIEENLAPLIYVTGNTTKALTAGESIEVNLIVNDDADQLNLTWEFLSNDNDQVGFQLLEPASINALNDNDVVTFEFVSEENEQPSTHEIQFSLTDKQGLIRFQNITFNVDATKINMAPSVELVSTADEIIATESFNFEITAQDVDGSIESIQWRQISGTSVTQENVIDSHAIKITAPQVSEVEVIEYEVVVSDNDGESTVLLFSFTIKPIRINEAPVIELNELTQLRGLASVQIEAIATDNDGSVESYLWTQTKGDAVVIAQLTSNSLLFTAPDVTELSEYEFTLMVTDNEGAQSQASTTINVSPKNKTPIITPIDDQSVKELQSLVLNAVANDEDGSVVSYQWVQIEGELLTLVDEDTSKLTIITADIDTQQSYRFELIVEDNENAQQSTEFELNVFPLIHPVINNNSVTSIDEKSLFISDISITDDGEVASFLWEQISGPSVELMNATQMNVSFETPKSITDEIIELKLTVIDEDQLQSALNVNLNVIAVNASPVIAPIADIEITDNQVFRLMVNVMDDDAIDNVALIQSELQNSVITKISNTEFDLTFDQLEHSLLEKPYYFSIVATDNEGAVSTFDVLINVLAQNDAPQITQASPLSVNEMEVITFAPLISDDRQSVDELIYLWEQVNVTESTLIIPLDEVDQPFITIAFASILDDQPFDLSLTVTDADGLSTTKIFNYIIKDNKIHPIIEPFDELTVEASSIINLPVVITDDESMLDVQWEQIIVDNEPVVLFEASDTQFSVTAPEVNVDTLFTFKVSVTDFDGLSATQTLLINVTNHEINLAPVITDNSVHVVNEQSSFTADILIEDDGSIESIVWEQISGPTVVLINANQSDVSFTSPVVLANQITPVVQLKISVTDNEGAISSTLIDVAIHGVNALPTFENLTDLEINDDQVYTLNVLTQDADGSVSDVQITQQASQSIAINKVSNTEFELTFNELSPELTAQIYTFEASVTDDEGEAIMQVFTINVLAQNESPMITINDSLQINESSEFTFTPVVLDDSISVNYLWEQIVLENAIVITLENTNEPQLEFTAPEVLDNQTLSFNLTVTDVEGLMSTQQFDIQIQDVQIPAIITLPSQVSAQSNESIDLNVLIQDDEEFLQIDWHQVVTGSEPLVNFTADESRFEFTTPEVSAVTSFTFELTVTDYDQLITSESVTIVVAPVKVIVAPTITMVSQVMTEPNADLMVSYELDDDDDIENLQVLWQQINVGDQDPITFTVTPSQFSISASQLQNAGTHRFLLTVTDLDGAQISQELEVVINPAPVIELPVFEHSIDEKTDFSLYALVSDDQEITVIEWLQIDDHDPIELTGVSDQQLAFTAPNISTSTVYDFAIHATDNLGVVSSKQISITVNPILIPPVIGLADTPININELESYTISADATDDESVADVHWQLNLPYDFISVTGENSDQLTIEAYEHHEQTQYEFELWVTDNDGLLVSQTVTVIVNQVFENPVIDMEVTSFTSSEYDMLQIEAQATDNQQYVEYMWQQIDDNGTLTLENTDQQILNVYSPDISKDTTYTLLLTVTDIDGLSDTQEINVTFTAVFVAPTLNLVVPEIALTDSSINFTANADDLDGEIVSILWTQTSGTQGVLTDETLDTATFVVSDVVEELTFEVTVTDNDNQSTTQSFSVSTEAFVEENAPKIFLGDDKTVNEGGQVYLQASTENTNDISVSYKWEQLTEFDFEAHTYNPNTYQFNAMDVISQKVIQIKVSLIDGNVGEVVATDVININVLNTDEYSSPFDIDAIIDENLKNCIAQNDYEFSEEVEEIVCVNASVESIVGIESFVNLQTLNVSQNLIVQSPNFGPLENLQNLDLSQNELVDTLDLTSLIELKSLNVSDTLISELQLPVDSNLRSLNAQDSQLESLSFEFIKSLSELNIKNTGLDCDYVEAQIILNGTHPLYASKEACIDALPINTYFAQYTSTAVVIDGDISGDIALWDTTYWQPIDVLWDQGTDKNDYPESIDISAQYKTLWDEDYVYVLVEVVDDIAITENAYWANDNVEIFIDENNTGGGHEDHHNSSNAFAFHINRLGESFDLHSRSVFQNEDNHVYTRITDQGNNTFHWEIRIALMDETFDPSNANISRSIEPNEVIGFTMSVIDADEQGNRQNFLGSVNTPEHIANEGFQNSDGFGALVLKSMPVAQ